MILYSKFSNDRRKAFSIRTDILEENGVKCVRKYPEYEKAENHIKKIAKHYEDLKEQFKDSPFEPCALRNGEGYVEFDYLEGETFKDIADRYLAEDKALLLKKLKEYLGELDKMATETFYLSDAYNEVFGDWFIKEGEPSMKTTDLDMILDNVIKEGDDWTVIDYEWTFDFTIPVKYVKWRVIYYYIEQDYKLEFFEKEELDDLLSITDEERTLFLNMESAFQEYVKGEHESLSDLYEDMSAGIVNVGDILAIEARRKALKQASVFIDKEGYFPPESRTLLDVDVKGNMSGTFSVKGVRAIRLDPGELPCYVRIKILKSDVGEVEIFEGDTNGIKVNETDWLFLCEDPQMIIYNWGENASTLSVVLSLWLIDPEFGETLADAALDNKLRIKKYDEIIHAESMELTRRSIASEALKGTFPMRAYRSARRRLGKGDPFEGVNPPLPGDTPDLMFRIDQKSYRENEMFVRGWALARVAAGETIEIFDASGRSVPAKIERTVRDDINKTYELPKGRRCGFTAIMDYKDIKDLPLSFKISEPRGYVSYTVNLEMDQEKRRERRILIEKGEIDAPDEPPLEYDEWISYFRTTPQEIEEQRNMHFPYEPLISIVIPLFNTPIQYLKEICESILDQSYSKIQLCLADGSTRDEVEEFITSNYGNDERVVYKRLTENKGISDNTNAALELADGDFIMLSDHDDIVARNACFEIVKKINEYDDVDMVYTDEDKITMDGQLLFDPHFKSDFNLDLLRSNNYICHIVVVRREVVEKAGKFRHEFDGAQDYDFILRCVENSRRISHVAKPVYHWRAHPASTAGNPESKLYAYENGRRAVQAHYDRLGIDARVEMTKHWGRYRSIFAVKGNPLVSIIIPNKDHKEDLKTAIDSIKAKTEYKNYEILIVENNSTTQEIFDYYDELERTNNNIKIIRYEGPFNYSKINNTAVKEAAGEYILFLNNDIEVIKGDWMTEMLGYAQRDDVGAVGAKLLFPNDRIQHVGVILGMGGAAGHMFYNVSSSVFTPGGRANSTQDLSAVTAACMMTKKAVFEEVGGFDEDFVVAFNDVDLCLKIRETGRLIVENVFAELYHHESASRGSDKKRANKERHERFISETRRFKNKWRKYYENGDPYYNPNLSLTRSDFSLRGLYNPYEHEDEFEEPWTQE